MKHLDEEILELTQEDKFEDEIKQVDSFKEGIYSAIAKIDKLCVTTPRQPFRLCLLVMSLARWLSSEPTEADPSSVQWRHHDLNYFLGLI